MPYVLEAGTYAGMSLNIQICNYIDLTVDIKIIIVL